MEERIPPHSDDAERSVLGAVMKNKEALFDVLEILTPEDFYSEIHKEIFGAVRDLNRASSPVDVLTVSEELKKRKTFEMVGGRAYVAGLTTMAPSTANASAYAKIIKENAVLRRLIEVSSDIIDKSYRQKTDAAQVLDYAEQGIFDIARMNQKKDFTALKDILWTNMDDIDRMAGMDGSLTGLTTGFADLDARTSGLQKSDLIILAARPSMGKTAFVLNVAQNAAIKGDAKVLIFSLEMSKEQLGQRLLSIDSCVELAKLKTGDLSRETGRISISLLTGCPRRRFISTTRRASPFWR